MKRLLHWARKIGLARFGYTQENFAHHHQLLRVWGPFMPARWEVYRWPAETGSRDLDEWMKPLPFGSIEAYHRIRLSAELVYSGNDWAMARDAFVGEYPDGTTDVIRPIPPAWQLRKYSR